MAGILTTAATSSATAAGLGVLIEYAKNLDAQMKDIADNERPRARRLIVDSASQVVRYASPYKKDALDLLKKYKPSAAVRAEDIPRITYEDAVNQADEAIGSQDWAKAIALLKAAIRKADPAAIPRRPTSPGYKLAFCYYKNNQLYEAEVLAEHLARRYPQGGVSPKSTEIAMQSLADAYNTYTEIDRLSDLDRLVNLAIYMVETWPEKEQADAARMNLSQIYSQTGRYDEAIEVLSSVRQRSQHWIPAQNRLGMVHWRKSRELERQGDATAAQAEAQKAIDALNVALKARRDASTGPTDPGLIGNVADLATVYRNRQGDRGPGPARSDRQGPDRQVRPRLRQADRSPAQSLHHHRQRRPPAIASMQALEQAGGAAGRAQLYFKLGKLLERELETLKDKKNTTALAELNSAYKTFLTTLAEARPASPTNRSTGPASLLDARRLRGRRESLPPHADRIHRKTPSSCSSQAARAGSADPDQAEAPRCADRGNSTRPTRDQRSPGNKSPLTSRRSSRRACCSRPKPRPAREAGQRPSALGRPYQEMERSRPRPESTSTPGITWPGASPSRKTPTKARQALLGVMRLSPCVGGPEMKAKYQGLLAKLK